MSKLVIVSNRLPITLSRKGDTIDFLPSSGGLVTALKSAKISNYVWIGWPGIEIGIKDKSHVEDILLKDYSCIPVYLEQKKADLFYNGFSNGIIWPLFHYFPEEINFNEAQWNAYHEVNSMFAETIRLHCQNEKLIWVHDYQLMLLPKMLRGHFPDALIGFFLHIPFLSSEIYKVLPVREEILEGLLGSNLIGFHTYDYSRHFINSCQRILNCFIQSDEIIYNGRKSKITVIPIGIDPLEFKEKLAETKTQETLSILSDKYEGKFVILGIDRLDYIKGIPNKLLALKRLFEKFPNYIGKVILLQIAIPSRTNVSEYQILRSYVNEIAGEINGIYGKIFHKI